MSVWQAQSRLTVLISSLNRDLCIGSFSGVSKVLVVATLATTEQVFRCFNKLPFLLKEEPQQHMGLYSTGMHFPQRPAISMSLLISFLQSKQAISAFRFFVCTLLIRYLLLYCTTPVPLLYHSIHVQFWKSHLTSELSFSWGIASGILLFGRSDIEGHLYRLHFSNLCRVNKRYISWHGFWGSYRLFMVWPLFKFNVTIYYYHYKSI
jgi:hypothetical protein